MIDVFRLLYFIEIVPSNKIVFCTTIFNAENPQVLGLNQTHTYVCGLFPIQV